MSIIHDREYEILLMSFVIQRCVKDSFPIDEYFLFEIPYYNDEFAIMYFENTKDYNQYHESGNHDIIIKEIAFEVHYDGQVIPLKTMSDGVKQVEADNCFEAVTNEVNH